MTDTFRCGDHETLVAFLYDECPPGVRDAMASHLVRCTRCAEEVASLSATRATLAAWRAPESTRGFTVDDLPPVPAGVIAPISSGAATRWWHKPLPAWAQTAAAAVIFTSGLALGTFRDMPPGNAAWSMATPSTVSPVTTPTTTTAVVSASDLAAVERRLQAEMAQLRESATVTLETALKTARETSPARANDEALLQRVRAMITASEQRQRTEFALRTTQMARQADTQRRVDLVHIQRRMGELQEVTGAAVRDQGQMVNYLFKVSQQQ